MKKTGLIIFFVAMIATTVWAEPIILGVEFNGATAVLTGRYFVSPGMPPQVILGDASIYENCRNLSSATITAWSAEEITIEITPEMQTAGATMYLFVLDGSGHPSGSGIPVEFQASPGTPDQPITTETTETPDDPGKPSQPGQPFVY